MKPSTTEEPLVPSEPRKGHSGVVLAAQANQDLNPSGASLSGTRKGFHLVMIGKLGCLPFSKLESY